MAGIDKDRTLKESLARAQALREGLDNASRQMVEKTQEAVRVEGERHQANMAELRRQTDEQLQGIVDAMKQIDIPALGLTRQLIFWPHRTKEVRSEVAGQISNLIEQARLGDPISQQILTKVDGNLSGMANVDRRSLPSLEWQVKPPKP